MNLAPKPVIGGPIDESTRALLEAHDHLRMVVGFLFEPGPRLVGYRVAEVGSFGDMKWGEVKALLSRIKSIEYNIRRKWVLVHRYDPERKARLRASRRQQRPLWEPVNMGMDERIWQRRVTED